ncbi:MAG: hypothetical protein Q4B22_11640, partial [Eubacteriales bacterium]|nr:hypothetical protein [Eubacteriales bacterium]
IRVYSRDEAGNSPESLDIINGRIGFQIDRTAPELTGFQELEETEGGEKTFRITAFDSLGLKEICIYLNDVCLQKADSFPDVHTAELTLQSGKENAGHLRITVEDLAGNRLDTDARDENGEYRFSPAFAFPRELQSGETKQENRRWKRGLKYAGIVLLGIVSGILGWSIGRRRKRS